MKGLRKLAFGDTARNIIVYTIYAVFSCYTLWKLISEESTAGKCAYGILLLLFLGIALWAEYLRYLYRTAIKDLTINCDLAKAKALRDKIAKKDIFHNYKNTLLIFDTLYYTDCNKPKKCLDIIQNNEKFFHSSLDHMLIYNYTSFFSYYMLDNKTKVKTFYPKVKNMRGAKVKGSKLSPLYSWDFIDAIFYLSAKDYKKSRTAFEQTSLDTMNMRERTHYHYAYAKLLMELHQKNDAVTHLQEVIAMGSSMAIVKDAKHLLQRLTGDDSYENE